MTKSRAYLVGGVVIAILVVAGGLTYSHYNSKNQEASLFNISQKATLGVTLGTNSNAANVTVVTSNTCGSAKGEIFSSAPTTNLCPVGKTASNVTATATGWTWICGAALPPVTCSASKCPVGTALASEN